jgi:hypothetical protein
MRKLSLTLLSMTSLLSHANENQLKTQNYQISCEISATPKGKYNYETLAEGKWTFKDSDIKEVEKVDVEGGCKPATANSNVFGEGSIRFALSMNMCGSRTPYFSVLTSVHGATIRQPLPISSNRLELIDVILGDKIYSLVYIDCNVENYSNDNLQKDDLKPNELENQDLKNDVQKQKQGLKTNFA